jgi:hypothetical protein
VYDEKEAQEKAAGDKEAARGKWRTVAQVIGLIVDIHRLGGLR